MKPLLYTLILVFFFLTTVVSCRKEAEPATYSSQFGNTAQSDTSTRDTFSCLIDGAFINFNHSIIATQDSINYEKLGLGIKGFSSDAALQIPGKSLSLSIKFENQNIPVLSGNYNMSGDSLPHPYFLAINYTVHNNGPTPNLIWKEARAGGNPDSLFYIPETLPFTITISSITTDRVKGSFYGTLISDTERRYYEQDSIPYKYVIIKNGIFNLPLK